MKSNALISSPKIEDLRALLHEMGGQGWKLNKKIGRSFSTGVACLDRLLEGGFTTGKVYECIASSIGSGSATLFTAILKEMETKQQWTALVDGANSFEPISLETDCSRLLWVRCPSAVEAIKATDFLLRDRNLALVILDLAFNPSQQLQKISSSTWFRFQRLLEMSSSAMLVLTSKRLVTSKRISFRLHKSFHLENLDSENQSLLNSLEPKMVQAQLERNQVPTRFSLTDPA